MENQNQEIKLTVTIGEVKDQVMITFPFDIREVPEGPKKAAAQFVAKGIAGAIESVRDTIQSLSQSPVKMENLDECEISEFRVRLSKVGKAFLLDMSQLSGFDNLTDENFKSFCLKIRGAIEQKLDEVYKKTGGKSKELTTKTPTLFGQINRQTDEQIKDALWSQRN